MACLILAITSTIFHELLHVVDMEMGGESHSRDCDDKVYVTESIFCYFLQRRYDPDEDLDECCRYTDRDFAIGSPPHPITECYTLT